jgi:hypothetical protein
MIRKNSSAHTALLEFDSTINGYLSIPGMRVWHSLLFFCGKGAELRGKEMVIIMNGKIDSNLVQCDSQEFLRSHCLIGV